MDKWKITESKFFKNIIKIKSFLDGFPLNSLLIFTVFLLFFSFILATINSFFILLVFFVVILFFYGIIRAGKEDKIKKEKEEKRRESHLPSSYWGGHFLYIVDDKGSKGEFIIKEDKFLFEGRKIGGNDKKIEIEIPFESIDFQKVSTFKGEDINYKNKMSAYGYFATGLPVNSFTKNIDFLVIPFKDKKGKIHNPKFSFDNLNNLEKVSRLIYEKF